MDGVISTAAELCYWSLDGGLNHISTHMPHNQLITGAAFDRYDTSVVSAAINNRIVRTNLPPPSPSEFLIGSSNSCLAVSQSQRWMLTGSNLPNRPISLFDITKSKKTETFVFGHHHPVTCVALSNRQSPTMFFASGDENGLVLVHQISPSVGSSISQSNNQHPGQSKHVKFVDNPCMSTRKFVNDSACESIRDLCFMKNNDHILVAGGDDNVVHVHNLELKKRYHQFNLDHKHNDKITSVMSSSQNSFEILSAGFDGSIMLHDMRQSAVSLKLEGDNQFTCADWHTNGHFIILGSSTGSVCLYDTRKFCALVARNLNRHATSVRTSKFTHVPHVDILQPMNHPPDDSQSANDSFEQPVSFVADMEVDYNWARSCVEEITDQFNGVNISPNSSIDQAINQSIASSTSRPSPTTLDMNADPIMQ